MPKQTPCLWFDTQREDPGRSQRAMQAMLQMTKIDIAELERAADQA